MNNGNSSPYGWFTVNGHVKQAFIAFVISILILAVSVFGQLSLLTTIVSAIAFLILCSICALNPVLGYYITFISCFFLLLPDRILNRGIVLPTGLIPEFLTYATLGGYLLQQKMTSVYFLRIFREPICLFALGLFLFYFLQFFNPYLDSTLGWFNFFRKQFSFLAFMYVSYCYFSTPVSFKRFTWFWIIVATLHVLYACKQQWFGFFPFEWEWIISDTERFGLYVNEGLRRKFGLVSDPASAGILYSLSALIMLILAIESGKLRIKLLLFGLAVLSMLASGYTGTRTGYLMLIAGFMFYLLLTLYRRNTLIISACFSIIIVVLLFVPAGNDVLLNRVQSLVKGTSDPSALVREVNRKMIQPYVYEHPFGGGINSSGMNGKRYSPHHYLSSVPPDSGYMQVMMEQGYVGLALILIFYFMILYKGIKQFYRIRDPELRTYTSAHLVAIFSLMVAQISQMAIGQYPAVLYFYTAIIFLIKVNEADNIHGSAIKGNKKNPVILAR